MFSLQLNMDSYKASYGFLLKVSDPRNKLFFTLPSLDSRTALATSIYFTVALVSLFSDQRPAEPSTCIILYCVLRGLAFVTMLLIPLSISPCSFK